MESIDAADGATDGRICVCHIGDPATAYASLSAMLLGPGRDIRDAVVRLADATSACPAFAYLDPVEIELASREAMDELRAPGSAKGYCEERAWLFGEGEFDPFLNGMSPAESTYLALDRAGLLHSLEATYAMAGYVVPACNGFSPCTAHMGVELDFMRHCLEHAEWGDERFARVARGFFGDHLREWGVLFAVVLRDKARHPAMRYLALALDQFIASEAITFAHSLPSLCIQRSLAD